MSPTIDHAKVAQHLARALFALGESAGTPCCRIEFRLGTYRDERPGGGLAEQPLARFLEKHLPAAIAAAADARQEQQGC